MGTAQMHRPKSKTQNWSAIFPEEQVTETQSMLFVKKLLAVAVSSVTYLRAIFPENAFGDRSLEDLSLKILREDNTCPGACQVIQWMKGCFDALDKKYLYMITIGIYENPEDPDTVIERYSFKFSYNGKYGIDIYRNAEKIAAANSKEETMKATIRLLRTLILLSQTLSPLPDDVMMTMKLFYYDDATPVDYQPPGFKECAPEMFTFADEAMNVKVGEVSTPFHTMKMKIGTVHHHLRYKDEEECTPMKEDHTIIQKEEKEATNSFGHAKIDEEESIRIPDTCFETKTTGNLDSELDSAPETTQTIPDTYDKTKVVVNGNSSPTTMEESTVEDEPRVKCHCGVNEDDGLMILCAICETWQHAVCFAILDADNAPEKHICAFCSQKFDNQKCTDPRLEKLDETEVKATCLWRRALIATSEMNRVTGSILAKRLGVPVHIASHLLKRLEKESYVKTTCKNKRLGKLVDKEMILKDGIDTYLRYEDSDIESAKLSQESFSQKEKESVAMIIAKASNLELAQKDEQPKTKTPALDEEMMEIKSILQKKGNGRKRAISKLNQETEFEITNSQDISNALDEQTPAKRTRKASAALHSLLV